MWEAAWFHKEIQALQDMFQGAGIARGDTRSDEGELVIPATHKTLMFEILPRY